MSLTVWHITFTTFGARLHGDDRLSVDRAHNVFGSPFVAPDAALNMMEQGLMSAPAVFLDHVQRITLERTIPQVCARWSWEFIACAAMPDHVHSLVAIERRYHGKQARSVLKRALTRALDERWSVAKRRDGMSWWCEGGSTKAVKNSEYYGNAYWYISRQRTIR